MEENLFGSVEKAAILLEQKKKTLALAESCTGGLMACLLTSRPGSSRYFMLSAVTYANRSKEKILGVRKESLEHYGAVSEIVAGEMALGARIQGDADYGLSLTGIAGPGGGSPGKPVGTLYVGLADEKGVFSWHFHENSGDRERNRRLFAAFAFERLYDHISKS